MPIKYLTDPNKKFKQFKDNIRSIYNNAGHPGRLKQGVNSRTIYDFEVQRNIYSCSAYFPKLNKIYIFYHVDDLSLIDHDAIAKKTQLINDYTIKHYSDFQDDVDIEITQFTPDNFRTLFEDPQDYVLGFNSNNYDLIVVAFILNWIYTKNALPSPEVIRIVNNLLISPKTVFNMDTAFDPATRSWLNKYLKQHLTGKNRKLGVRDLQNIFSFDMYTPNLAKVYSVNLNRLSYLFYNLKSCGYHVDLRGLNEKDKDTPDSSSPGQTASLKRISAQLGFQIEEPEEVDLSSNKPLTEDQITNLLAYNVSDILVTTLIFNTQAYQNVLSTREQLIDRFGDQFEGKRTVNSTSANFVESVIAPNEKLNDEPEINVYYPVHGQKFDTLQAKIDKEYAKTLSLDKIKELDKTWTNKIRQMPNFKAHINPKDGKLHERYRVHYGEIQEDLLELLASFPKFPKNVYIMYNYFRGAKSVYDEIDGKKVLTKTAREVAVENFIRDYPKPMPGFKYSKKQGTDIITGVRCDVTIAGQPMVLSFSVGGVHGEVIDDKSYERDNYLINTYNNVIDEAKKYFDNNALKASDYHSPFYQRYFKDAASWTDKHNPISQVVTNAGKPTANFKTAPKQVTAKDYVIPIDMSKPIHVDVDSLYPSLMINLHMFAYYMTEYAKKDTEERFGHWKDTYARLRAERVRLKKWAERVPKENWDDEHYHAWDIQLLNKLLLNSASGIADGKWDTNIRMNNRAASMRIMGQLILTYLILSVEPKGFYSVSTNTDGVYLTSKDPDANVEQITDEIEEWKQHFHLGATPEIMTRFISKDANNRFEQQSDKDPGNAAGGIIANFEGASSSSKMKQPFIVDETIVAYFKSHQNVATSKVDIKWLYDYMKKRLDSIRLAKKPSNEIDKTMLSFAWTVQPSKGEAFVLESEREVVPMQHVNRLFLTTAGYNITCYKTSGSKTKIADEKLTDALSKLNVLEGTEVAYRYKITNFEEGWHVVRANLDLSRYFGRNDIWNNIDLDAYVEFTRSRIVGKDAAHPIWVQQPFKLSKRLETFNKWLIRPYEQTIQ